MHIHEVEVKYVPATVEQLAELDRELANLNPGWSFQSSNGTIKIDPPAHVSPERRDEIRTQLDATELGRLSMEELTELLTSLAA